MRNSALLLAALLSATATPAQAAEFVNELTISGTGSDLSGLGAGPNASRLGGFGSDLVYDRNSGLFHALTDRGPGGGLIDYIPRIQSFTMAVNYMTGAISGFTLVNTTLLKQANGTPFTGLNPLLNGDTTTVGNSLDPEGLVLLANGNYLVSDEYGPSVIEFAPDGTLVRTFETPANLLPRKADGTTDFTAGRPDIVNGRQDNRGFEGLTVSADGSTAYAVLQDPLVDEGSSNDGRRSRNVRIVAFDMATGEASGQFIYQLESRDTINAVVPTDTFSATNQGRSIGVSSIHALEDGRLILIERDNRGLGVDDPNAARPVGLKSAFVIDLVGATDVSAISLAGSNALPAGVVAAAKTPFLDIRAKLLAAGIVIPEKLEGLAFGPRLAGGGVSLIVMSDNDYSVTQTGAGEQFDVCTSGAGGVTSQVALGAACPDGQSLIPTRIFSFALSQPEAAALGFAGVPEPSTWAQLLLGFFGLGGLLRHRRAAGRTAAHFA